MKIRQYLLKNNEDVVTGNVGGTTTKDIAQYPQRLFTSPIRRKKKKDDEDELTIDENLIKDFCYPFTRPKFKLSVSTIILNLSKNVLFIVVLCSITSIFLIISFFLLISSVTSFKQPQQPIIFLLSSNRGIFKTLK